MTKGKYNLKIKIANCLHFLTTQAFLFCFHCGEIPTLAPNARVAIFPVKHLSLHGITFITTILEEYFMIGYTPFWLITLFSKSIFTLIKKNVRDLVVRNNEYTRDEGFLKGLWRNFVSTRLIFCVIILASLVCFPCFNSVSYDFHCFQYSQGKTMFYSAQCKNGWLAASDLFDMFIQWIKFYYTFYYYV